MEKIAYEIIIDCPKENLENFWATILGSKVLKEDEESLIVDILRIKYISDKPRKLAEQEFANTKLRVEDTLLKKYNTYFVYTYFLNHQEDCFEVDMKLDGHLKITKDIEIGLAIPPGVKFEIKFITNQKLAPVKKLN